jgi:hypothetical protein
MIEHCLRLRQEDHKFKTSLGKGSKPFLLKNKNGGMTQVGECLQQEGR